MDESHRGKTMRKQAAYVMILSILLFTLIQTSIKTVSSSTPTKLQIYVGPPKVLADNDAYEAIFVQLQDSSGVPARAQTDINISLSSSLTYVGSVDPKITMTTGSTYAVATFYSTFTPGSTIITAAATGFAPVFASITTVGPVPSKLAVCSLPPTLPADGGAYQSVVVQLQDAGGSPAKAPIGDVNVTLSSSDLSVGTVDSSVLISAGSTYAVGTFYTNASSSGSATVTALSSGYISGQATVKTDVLSANATKLKVYVGPPKVPADGVVYEMIAVQLQDGSGKIVNATGDITVFLSSSNVAVGTVDLSITISENTTYSIAKFYSTYKSETTSITAAASDYASSQEALTTVGPVPTKLAVYCVPSKLSADGRSYDAIVVQLQDSAGNPARDPIGNVTVELFSSVPEAGNVSSPLVILYGQTHSIASFSSTFDAGSVGITALTPNYSSGQSTMTTYVIDQYALIVSVTANPTSVNSGNQTTITVYIAYGGLVPASGATVTLASNKGGNFSAATDEGDGNYTSVFTAPNVTAQTVCTISVNASKLGYITGHGTAQVTVNATVTVGDLKLYIKDAGDSPIEGATVNSISQPSGISSLSATTDSDGEIVFEDIPAGVYVFEITKDGYETTTENVTVVPAGAVSYTFNMASSASGLPLPILVVIIIVVALVTGLVATLILRRRRKPEPEQEPAAEP
jgi:adhesin/invasin